MVSSGSARRRIRVAASERVADAPHRENVSLFTRNSVSYGTPWMSNRGRKIR